MNEKLNFKNKKVLVTGGLGFIGSNLARRLVELGADVLIVDSMLPDYGGNIFNIEGFSDKVKIDNSDIRDADRIKLLVKDKDYIFNLAGQVSHLDSMKDPFVDLEINCRSQLSILEACRNFNRDVKIIFTSTRQVYGKPDYLPVDEKHLLHPTDVNGINKMAGEWYHILYNNVYGIKSVSLRLTNTYGPRLLMKHNRQGFIGWFVRQAIDNEEIKIFGDGAQLRDFNYVDDVIDALLLAATSDKTNGEIYNLGSGKPLSLLEFVKILLAVCGSGKYSITPFPEEKRKIDIGDYYADFSKFKGETGWVPAIAIPEGLRSMVEYYKKYKEHYWNKGKTG